MRVTSISLSSTHRIAPYSGQERTIMEEKKPTVVNELNSLLDPTDFEEEDVDESEGETDKARAEDNSSKESPKESEKSAEDLAKEKEEKAKRDSHYAKLRREKEAKERAEKEKQQAEREERIRKEAEIKAKLEMAKTNTFTNEPIVDEEDLKIFEIQQQLDAEGKDPINDLPKRLGEINRKKNKEAKELAEKQAKAQSESREKSKSEVAELREKYPKLNTAILAKDELFQELLEQRAGRWTLLEIYELYLTKKEKETKKSTENAKEITKEAEKMTKVPSSAGNGNKPSKSVADMTQQEFEEYWRNKYGN